MTQDFRYPRYLTMIFLAILALGELMICIKGSSGPSQLGDALRLFSFSAIPLLFVFSSVLLGEGLRFPIFLGWVCILIGFAIQYNYYASRDPSAGIIIIISMGVYWLCGLLALISVSYQKP